MKLLFLLFGLTFLKATDGSGFYDIEFKTIDGTVINASAYSGKKVIVAVVSASTQNLNLIQFLDSLQKNNSSIQVIAVPTGDFGGNVKLTDLKNLKKNLSIVITEPFSVKKANSNLQHPLLAWLTNVKQNTHFDMDVTGEGHVFMINRNGEMVSCLSAGVPKEVLLRLIQLPK
jgi:glutathione peroxidase-family protein